MKAKLTKKQVTSKLKALGSDWVVSSAGTSMSRKFLFRNYMAGFMFVTKVSVHAEVMGHHPEVLLTYKAVKITLSTHDVSGLTAPDFSLAEKCNSLYTLSTENVVDVHNHY